MPPIKGRFDFNEYEHVGSIELSELLKREFETEVHQDDQIVLIRFRGFKGYIVPDYAEAFSKLLNKPLERYVIGYVDAEFFHILDTAMVTTKFWDQFPFLEHESEM